MIGLVELEQGILRRDGFEKLEIPRIYGIVVPQERTVFPLAVIRLVVDIHGDVLQLTVEAIPTLDVQLCAVVRNAEALPDLRLAEYFLGVQTQHLQHLPGIPRDVPPDQLVVGLSVLVGEGRERPEGERWRRTRLLPVEHFRWVRRAPGQDPVSGPGVVEIGVGMDRVVDRSPARRRRRHLLQGLDRVAHLQQRYLQTC